jgi:DNA modification methylase
MDVFNGTATSGCVANVLKRNYLGFELNPAYIKQSIVRFESPQTTKKNLLKVA